MAQAVRIPVQPMMYAAQAPQSRLGGNCCPPPVDPCCKPDPCATSGASAAVWIVVVIFIILIIIGIAWFFCRPCGENNNNCGQNKCQKGSGCD